jgi:hypothetical protein
MTRGRERITCPLGQVAGEWSSHVSLVQFGYILRPRPGRKNELGDRNEHGFPSSHLHGLSHKREEIPRAGTSSVLGESMRRVSLIVKERRLACSSAWEHPTNAPMG